MADYIERPNTRSREQGIFDLTQGIGPIRAPMEDGVYVITYCINPDIPEKNESNRAFYNAGVNSLHPVVNQYNIATMRRIFDEVEKCANIRFKQVDSNNADIDIFLGFDMHDTTAGYQNIYPIDANNHPERKEKRYIIMNPKVFDQYFAHELGHALGLSHPEHQLIVNQMLSSIREQNKRIIAGELKGPQIAIPQLLFTGNSPAYNTDGSRESYQSGQQWGSFFHYAAYDRAALKSMYGESKNPESHLVLNTNNELPFVISSPQPVTLEVEPNSGIYRLALPSTNVAGVVPFTDVSTLDFNTYVANVKVSPNVITDKELIGNELPNQLQGGSGNDRLVTAGIGDLLTGNAGRDQFVLTPGSFQALISDWTPEDKIMVSPETHRIVIQRHNDRGAIGTQLLLFNSKQQLISCAYLPNARSEALEHHISNGGFETDFPLPPAPPKHYDLALQEAVALVRGLDIEMDANNSLQPVPDNYLSPQEVSRISLTSPYGLSQEEQQDRQRRRQLLQKACDLNGNGDTCFGEISLVLNEVEKSGLAYDQALLRETLLTGSIPVASANIPYLVNNKHTPTK